MPLETFLALVLFAFTTSITPGPNNMMLFASGVNFGFRRTVPHMLGIGAGFLSLLICVGLGLGALMQSVPVVYTVLKFAGGLYLVWRSEEHTSELQSLMRISYAVFCLKKKIST